jgi:glycosyltransferase involved in cell wall biosynthesis
MTTSKQSGSKQSSSQAPISPVPILKPYLLVINIPCYIDAQNRRYLDLSWYVDLIRHLDYIQDFILACPCSRETPPANAVLLEGDRRLDRLRLIDLPAPTNFLSAIAQLPRTLFSLWRAVQQAEVVHAGIAGYPIPLGWLVTPIVRLQKKFYLLIVESAPWRLRPGVSPSLKERVMAVLHEQLGKWCMHAADLAIFTQAEYRQSLLHRHPETGHIIHASWISEETILSEAAAIATWRQKLTPATQTLRVLFAGRLLPAKGVTILLAAMQRLSQDGVAVKLDILGEGELFDACQQASEAVNAPTEIRLLGTVPYGPAFFERLQAYHAVVVPSLSDEQPRVVYDAYSQAVPVLVSNTNGLRDCVQSGQTGMMVPAHDPVALAELLRWSLSHLPQLQEMGLAGLAIARKMTHQEMHRRRWQLLSERLGESSV